MQQVLTVFLSLHFVTFNKFAVKVVKSVDYYISEEYVNGVYDNCKGVIVPASGGYAMDLSCGRYDLKSCTAKRFVS